MVHIMFSILVLYSICREHHLYIYNYDKYTLFRGIPKTEKQLGFFQNLSVKYYVNFWTYPGRVYRPVDFVTSPRDREKVLVEALWNGIDLTPVIENIQEAFDNQTVSYYVRRRTDSFNWESFYKINDIYGWLTDLAEIHSDKMTLKSIGTTHEGRNIMAAEIALGRDVRRRPRPKVFIEGGIHAREWISPAVVTYFINEIVNSQYSTNPTWKVIAKHYEWHIVPIVNPDGYVFSHDKNRMWRKNRRSGGGVDLNRNFAHAFCTKGASKIQHHDTYCGSHAFSEPESRAVADYVRSNSRDLRFYLAFHAYSQLMIIPYADSKEKQDNYNVVIKMARVAAIKIERRFHIQYRCGTAYETVGYFASGVSSCWVKKVLGVPYVMTFELRDQGKYGFALPTEQILPTCIETLDGITSFLNIGGTPPLTKDEDVRLIKMESGHRSTQNDFILHIIIVFAIFSLMLM